MSTIYVQNICSSRAGQIAAILGSSAPTFFALLRVIWLILLTY